MVDSDNSTSDVNDDEGGVRYAIIVVYIMLKQY